VAVCTRHLSLPVLSLLPRAAAQPRRRRSAQYESESEEEADDDEDEEEEEEEEYVEDEGDDRDDAAVARRLQSKLNAGARKAAARGGPPRATRQAAKARPLLARLPCPGLKPCATRAPHRPTLCRSFAFTRLCHAAVRCAQLCICMGPGELCVAGAPCARPACRDAVQLCYHVKSVVKLTLYSSPGTLPPPRVRPRVCAPLCCPAPADMPGRPAGVLRRGRLPAALRGRRRGRSRARRRRRRLPGARGAWPAHKAPQGGCRARAARRLSGLLCLVLEGCRLCALWEHVLSGACGSQHHGPPASWIGGRVCLHGCAAAPHEQHKAAAAYWLSASKIGMRTRCRSHAHQVQPGSAQRRRAKRCAGAAGSPCQAMLCPADVRRTCSAGAPAERRGRRAAAGARAGAQRRGRRRRARGAPQHPLRRQGASACSGLPSSCTAEESDSRQGTCPL